MALHKGSELQGGGVTILDLPEPVFREIFTYLDLETVYLMKHLCQQINEYVNGFLEFGGTFMLSTGRNIPSEIIHIYKQRNKEAVVYSRLVDPFPYPRGFRATDLGSFGANLNQNIVFGVYHGHIESFKFSVQKFNPLTNEWSPIHAGQKKDAGYSNQGDPSNKEKKKLWRGGPIISSCAISSSSLILFYGGYSDANNSAQLLKLYENDSKHRTEYSLCDIEIPQSLKSIKEFTLIRISSNQIMLIGGVHCSGLQERNISTILWEGTLDDEENTVNWRSIDFGIGKPRLRPVCFKLNDTLYITGGHKDCFEDELEEFCMHFEFEDGIIRQQDPTTCRECLLNKSSIENKVCTCCYEYNFVDETYYKTEHFFDVGEYQRYHISNVLTDKDDNFTIVAPFSCTEVGFTESKSLKISIFTPEEVFSEIPDFRSNRGINVNWNHPKLRSHLNVLVQIG